VADQKPPRLAGSEAKTLLWLVKHMTRVPATTATD
jgi:hypothetical protein